MSRFSRSFRRSASSICLLIVALVAAGCSSSPTSNEDENGLRPGNYAIQFEIFSTINTPEEALGRHRIVFRVNSPGESASDFEVVSSRRVPPTGSNQEDYLVIDAEQLDVETNRWILRFQSRSEAYSVSLSLGNAGFGDFQVTSGCFIRVPTGATFSGSGCIVDRA